MIKKGYVDISLGQVHYRQRQGAGTAAVYLHQTASSSRMWEQVITAFTPGRRHLAFDTPGFGGSDDPPGMPAMADYGRWLTEAIDACAVGTFDLVGHHTGACIAAEIVALVPERVRSVAMIGPLPLTPAERETFRQHYSTPFSPTADGQYLLDTWEYLRQLGADSELALHHRELIDTVRAYYGRFQAYSAVWDQDFTALFQAIDCPLLLMCAGDDVLYPYFQRAGKMRPEAGRRQLRGTNFEPDQDSQSIVEALQAFWPAQQAGADTAQ